MSHHFEHDLADSFPENHNDEPESLRQDILDELADHLACAARRELHQRSDSGQIQEAVIERFGDPSKVARQLWRDAMWERIMTQRVMMVFSGILVLLMCGLCVAFWNTVQSSQRFQQQTLAAFEKSMSSVVGQLSEAQEQNREMSASMLAAIQSSAERQEGKENSAPSEWNEVKLILVTETEDGPPAEKIHVRVNSLSDQNQLPPFEAVSDESGVIAFPLVRYGTYSLSLSTSQRGGPVWQTLDQTLIVPLNEAVEEKIVCPGSPLKPLQVQVRCELPEDLAEVPFYFSFDRSQFVSCQLPEWQLRGVVLDGRYDESYLVRVESQGVSSGVLITPDNNVFSIFGYSYWRRFGDMENQEWMNTSSISLLDFTPNDNSVINWPDANAHLSWVTFLLPSLIPNEVDQVARNSLTVADQRADLKMRFMMRSFDRQAFVGVEEPFLKSEFITGVNGNGLRIASIQGAQFETMSYQAGDFQYELEAGEPGVMKITPSEHVINELREHLAKRRRQLKMLQEIAEEVSSEEEHAASSF